MTALRIAGLALLLGAALGCARSGGSIDLLPPFSDDTVVGTLKASWHDTGRQRVADAAGAVQHEVMVRVDAQNRLSDRLYVALGALRLRVPSGSVEVAEASTTCSLAPGNTPTLLAGRVWLPAAEADRIRGFQIDHLAVPLSQRGLAIYREYLLGQHRGDPPAIDSELAALGAAPPCASAPDQ